MTPDQVKQQFRREGKTFTAFARENDIPVKAIYRVLNGQYKAHYGQAHDIAVKLGLKSKPDQRAAA